MYTRAHICRRSCAYTPHTHTHTSHNNNNEIIPKSPLFFDFIFLQYLFVPCGKLGWPYQVRHSSRKSSATHCYQYLQHFRVAKQGCGCHRSGLLTCAQMSMPAIAHGDTHHSNEIRTKSPLATKMRSSRNRHSPQQ